MPLPLPAETSAEARSVSPPLPLSSSLSLSVATFVAPVPLHSNTAAMTTKTTTKESETARKKTTATAKAQFHNGDGPRRRSRGGGDGRFVVIGDDVLSRVGAGTAIFLSSSSSEKSTEKSLRKNPPPTTTTTSTQPPQPRVVASASASASREPAGVESIFAVVKTARRKLTTRLVASYTTSTANGTNGRRGRKIIGSARLRRIRRASSKPTTMTTSLVTDAADAAAAAAASPSGDAAYNVRDVERINEIASKFTSQVKSALKGSEEGRRLATAKLLLEEDLKSLRSQCAKGATETTTTTTATALAAAAAAATMESGNTLSSDDCAMDLIEAYPDAYGDLRLLRFLRKERNSDPISASIRFREYMQWRNDEGIDKIRAVIERQRQKQLERKQGRQQRQWVVGSGLYEGNGREDYENEGDDDDIKDYNYEFMSPERFNLIERYLPCDFDLEKYLDDNYDYDGDKSPNFGKDQCPPIILYAGKWDTVGLTDAIRTGETRGKEDDGSVDGITLDDFLTYWVYIYESIHVRLYETSIRLGTMAYLDEVCDLRGMSLRQFGPTFISQVLKPWLDITQRYYPETARKIYFFEPPKIIDVAWKIVTPMVSEGTVRKVQFRRGYDGTSLDFIKGGGTMDH